MIRLHAIEKSFGSLKVLHDISLEIASGEFVAIVGPSGAGKTTLLQIMGALERPDQGQIWMDGNNLSTLTDLQLSRFRNQNLAYVFQFHNLLPEFSAIENIQMPAWIHGQDRRKSHQRALELLDYFGLLARKDHRPSELSGGEQQRIAVARALMNHPKVLLADEPSGNLDSLHARALHELFLKLKSDFGQTAVVVTHNLELAAMADRSIRMVDGQVVQP